MTERRKAPVIDFTAFDTETGLIAPGNQAPMPTCIVFADRRTYVVGVHERQAKDQIFALVEGDELLVGHNVAFDLMVLCREWPKLLPLVFDKYMRNQITDTGICEKLQHNALGKLRGVAKVGKEENGKPIYAKLKYGLADLAWRHLNVELEKGVWQLRFGELRGVDVEDWPEEAEQYALEDGDATRDVFLSQREYFSKKYLKDQYRQARADWWLTLMGAWGIHTYGPEVRRFERQLTEEFESLQRRLCLRGLVDKKGSRNTKVLKKRIEREIERTGGELVLTPKGGICTNSDVLDSFDDPILQMYARYSSLMKQLSTDIKLLKLGTSTPIHSNFEVLQESGRTGSSSPNLQNLPTSPGVRECFAPREGFVFAAADYSQFELRTLAQVCISRGWKSRLGEALNAGVDPHLKLASVMLSISYEEADERNKAGEQKLYLTRQTAKVGNFGYPGGLGIANFVKYARKNYGVIISEEEARELKYKYWYSAWPEMQLYLDWIGEICEAEHPQIKQLFSNRYRGGMGFCDGANTFFQGLAADAAKAAGFLIADECYVDHGTPLFGCRLVNFVHDEFILEAPEEYAPEAAERLVELMIEGAEPFLPDVPPLAEPVLMRQWSKKAKELRDDNGRLVPWERGST